MESPRLSPLEQNQAPMIRAEQLLKKIDFGLLRTIFTEEVRKSGLDPNHTNLRTLDDGVKLGTIERPAEAGYMPWTNEITVDPEKISEQLPPEGYFENEIFAALCHEETHAVSQRPHTGMLFIEVLGFLLNKPTMQVGVEYSTRSGQTSFNILNEAITDTVGEEVYDEYVRRSGDRSLFSDHAGRTEFPRRYIYGRIVLRAFLSALSRVTDIPEEVVWVGLKQSFFSGANLASRELTKLYEEILRINIVEIMRNPTSSHHVSGDTIKQLNRIGTDEVEELVKELAESVETMNWSAVLKKRATNALRKLIPSGASDRDLK